MTSNSLCNLLQLFCLMLFMKDDQLFTNVKYNATQCIAENQIVKTIG